MKKTNAKNKTNEHYVKICPKCGSIDVGVDFSNPVVWDYGTTTKYKCSKCGNLSPIFPEIMLGEVQNFRGELKQKIADGEFVPKKEDLVDTSAGFSLWIMFAIISLMGLAVQFVVFIYSPKKDGSTITHSLYWLLIYAGLLVFIWKKFRRRNATQ